jgi:hypothetical protein
MATLHELQTVYGVRDLYVMIEIDRVNKANAVDGLKLVQGGHVGGDDGPYGVGDISPLN